MSAEPETLSTAAELTSLAELARKFSLPLVAAVADEMLAPDLAADLPVEWARSHLMLPIRQAGRPALLLNDPADLSARKHLELLLNQELPPVLASKAVIMNAIERGFFNRSDTASEFLRDLDQRAPAPDKAARGSDDLLQVAEHAPITQLINLILLEAIKANASDIHVEPFQERLRVRFRIDGMLYEQTSPPKHLESALVSRLKVMARMDIAEKRLPQDGVARVRVGEREIDIRVSTVPVAEGERVVLRLLNRNTTVLPLAALGLAPAMLTALERVLQEPNGIMIVSGPTGSGKTTTLYAALQQLNKSRANILTIEDPIEYQIPDIGQMQVKPKIGLTFASGLRHILRQDPDTILVGEIRDLETAAIAVRASLTGHLVFTTLHTNDAPSAVIRMIDMGVEPYLLASCLRAVLAQRLLRKLCEKCRKPTTLAASELAALPEAYRRKPPQSIYAPQGCPACLEGYKGRTGLFELMVVTPELADAICAAQPNLPTLRTLSVRGGMTTLLEDGLAKLSQGLTSFTELLRTIPQPAC
ncbi:MAG: type II/IV secretion system protein [Lentisphaerae bacterium]|nr:type II/IV secretion system protein [Lentisphaerota bacterium]